MRKQTTSLESSARVAAEAAERALAAALELRRKWPAAHIAERSDEVIPLIRSFNAPTESIGFFGRCAIAEREIPVMGVVEDRAFDRSKSGQVHRFQSELREFVLNYLMRVSDFRRPSALPKVDAEPPRFLRSLSWCPSGESGVGGFGYSQHWYKLRATGEVRRFPAERRYEIVDMREIGQTYDWIIARVRIFDFSITATPFGPDGPQLSVPLEEASYIVINREFIADENEKGIDEDGRSIVGRYGVGYAFIKNPEEEFVGYGPGQFDIACQQFLFRLYENGEARVKLTFIANRPQRIANVPFAPLDWGLAVADTVSLGLLSRLVNPLRQTFSRPLFRLGSFDPVSTGVELINLLTGRQAERLLCISRAQLEKAFLLKHFDQHYQMISGALQTWRQIPDWTDSAALPDWVRTGVSS